MFYMLSSFTFQHSITSKVLFQFGPALVLTFGIFLYSIFEILQKYLLVSTSWHNLVKSKTLCICIRAIGYPLSFWDLCINFSDLCCCLCTCVCCLSVFGILPKLICSEISFFSFWIFIYKNCKFFPKNVSLVTESFNQLIHSLCHLGRFCWFLHWSQYSRHLSHCKNKSLAVYVIFKSVFIASETRVRITVRLLLK